MLVGLKTQIYNLERSAHVLNIYSKHIADDFGLYDEGVWVSSHI